jgi:O-antigen/teichoic acid export membrane protein
MTGALMSRLLARDRVTTSVGLVLSLLIVQRVISFARGIVFARVLGTEQYGVYTLSFFLIPIIVIVAGLGIPSAFGRFIPRYEERGAVRWFLRNTYTLTLLCGAAAAAVIILVPGLFSSLLYGDPSHTAVITLAAICVPIMLLFRNVSSTFLGLRLFRASSLFEFIQMAAFAAVGTAMVFVFRSATSAIFSYAVSFVIGLVLFAPLLAGYTFRQEPLYRALDERDFYRRLLRFSVWLTITPILAQVFHYVDRLSIQRLMTSSDQGIYSAMVALAQMISALGLAVNNVIYPHLSAAWEKNRREEALQNLDLAMRVTSLALLVIGAAIILLGDVIVRALLGEAYAPGVGVLPYLVVFYLFTISVWLLGVYPSLIERTYIATVGLVIALPVNIGLNLALIPRMGIVGAALATMLSYLVMWWVVLGLCRRFGLRISARTLVLSLAPLFLLLPGLWAGAAVVLLAVTALATGLIFTAAEKSLARNEALRFVRSLRRGHGEREGPGPTKS